MVYYEYQQRSLQRWVLTWISSNSRLTSLKISYEIGIHRQFLSIPITIGYCTDLPQPIVINRYRSTTSPSWRHTIKKIRTFNTPLSRTWWSSRNKTSNTKAVFRFLMAGGFVSGWPCANPTLPRGMTFWVAMSIAPDPRSQVLSTYSRIRVYNGSLRCWSSNGDRRKGQLTLSLLRGPKDTPASAGLWMQLSQIDTRRVWKYVQVWWAQVFSFFTPSAGGLQKKKKCCAKTSSFQVRERGRAVWPKTRTLTDGIATGRDPRWPLLKR